MMTLKEFWYLRAQKPRMRKTWDGQSEYLYTPWKPSWRHWYHYHLKDWVKGIFIYDIPAMFYKAIRCIKCRTGYCTYLMGKDNEKYFAKRRQQELIRRGLDVRY